MGKRTGILALAASVFVGISMLLRTVLLVKSLEQMDLTAGLIARIYGTGLFFDLVTFAYCSIPFMLYLALVPDKLYNHSWHRAFVRSVYFAVLGALVFNAAAEYLFFDEFGTRYNFIAVDYLVYTREVIGNIKESYPLPPIFAGIFLVSLAIYAGTRKFLARSFSGESTLRQRLLAAGVFACVPVLSVLFVDLSFTSVSKNSFANELAGNGLYDLVAAFRSSELDYGRFYATRDEQAVLAMVRDQMREKNNNFVSADPRELTRSIVEPGPREETERHRRDRGKSECGVPRRLRQPLRHDPEPRPACERVDAVHEAVRHRHPHGPGARGHHPLGAAAARRFHCKAPGERRLLLLGLGHEGQGVRYQVPLCRVRLLRQHELLLLPQRLQHR